MQANNIIRVIATFFNYVKRITHLGFSIDCRIHVIMLLCFINRWHRRHLMHTDPDFQSKIVQFRSLFVFVHFQIDMSILSITRTIFLLCLNLFYGDNSYRIWAYLLVCRAIASPCPSKPIRWILAFSPRTICLNIIEVDLNINRLHFTRFNCIQNSS